MRTILLLVLLAPVASAWSVEAEAPPETPAGVPFDVRACAAGPPGAAFAWKAHLTLDGRTLAGSARYGPPREMPTDGRLCESLRLAPRDEVGEAALLVRVRPTDGPVASWTGSVRLVRADAPPLRILAVHTAPFPGVTIEHVGDAPLGTEGLVLAQGSREWPLPSGTIAPGARVFVGATPPPDASGHLAADVAPRVGNLTLRHHARLLDVFPVPRLDPGEVATREGVRVAGRTSIPARPLPVQGNVTAFVTPDAGAAPLLALLDGARREILVASYTFTSEDAAAALARAAARGVRVRVLLEGAPVGGVPEEERRLLAALGESGAEARLLRTADGFPARYRAMHAKVVVVDEARVLVSTENLHASSYPPRAGAPGTRGYGLIVEDAAVARVFAEAFRADAAAWPDVREPAGLPSPEPLGVAVGATEGPLLRTRATAATPILAPDDPLALAEAVRAAERSVDVALLFADARWGDAPNPLLDAAVEAGRRGARVRILLDGHADPARSHAVADALAGLPVEVRVDEPGRTLHAKVVIVDGARAYVGSMNWGRASATQNREAGILLDAPEVAAFFGRTFEEDWSGGAAAAEVMASGAAAAVIALALSALRARGRSRRPRA